ncbi:8-amino-7-oxononanoate synthase protein [Salinisphaera shabanensis E1L3A]|uniref:8-amino-7-oxononanoate synthase n=1 Tax=Salinisphaera shabanensis E1L3A TaxID=1033802 RepID=U2FNT9_9GAMM|nr:8-amino-7-oxononanoate synthase [Salinisphaera shabanensis]ERJ17849.1 8-amino-7-oxononanoate synthase protein [Salinisphaera shabanensis E1L3A]
MTQTLAAYCRERVAVVRAADRFRRRRVIEGAHGSVVVADGQRCVNFCSNDYLGLASEPALARRMARAGEQLGTGSAASQLVTGHNAEHAALEAELADWVGRERALLFSTGYAANVGVISALMGKADHVVADALNHASLIDGARLSGAQKHVYVHADADDAARQLAACGTGNRLLVTDSIFSMDGDTAPLSALAEQAAEHSAWLAVDDAHGLGVFGPQGGGRVAEARLDSQRVPLLLATLGKSVGAAGAFVAGDDVVIEAILQSARSLIFSTAPPPALAAAAREGVALARAGDRQRVHLMALIERFRHGARALGLPVSDSDSPIQPLLLGDEAQALAASDALLARGFLVGAIRPPTVAPGTSRLRITLTAGHDEAQVEGLLAALAAAVAPVTANRRRA